MIPPNGTVTRYSISSTDVIADMRINVCPEGSDKVLWFKERFLSDTEIVEHLVHNPTSTIQWTIHKPKRGWYIRIRSPSFPPDTFIQLLPLPTSSPYYVEGAISFQSRTNVPFPALRPIGESSTTGTHSYPPTPPPPATAVLPAAQDSAEDKDDVSPAKSGAGQRRQRTSNHPPATQVTPFLLSPHSFQPSHPSASASLLSRAISVLKNSKPSHSNSFTLTRLPVDPSTSATSPTAPPLPPPYTSQTTLIAPSSISLHLGPGNESTSALPSSLGTGVVGAGGTLSPPLLTFHDQTPLFTVRSLKGLIEINEAEQLVLGVDTSFWIAVTLTYLEFLEDREGYLAAMYD